MSDITPEQEMIELREQAQKLGLKVHHKISLEALRTRVKEALENEEVDPETETPAQLRARLYKKSMRLVRVRITNNDPRKKDLKGEIFTVANGVIGTVKKYIPYGEESADGWHIPQVLFDNLDSRKYLHIELVKGKEGTAIPQAKWHKEFTLEILPDLTAEELADMRAAELRNRE